MFPSDNFSRVVEGKRYSVKDSTLIASDRYWDGRNFERNGRNTFLYRTANGRYFTVNLTQWQGERDTITPVSVEDARDFYENSLSEHEVEYEAAFPGVKVEAA